MCFCCGAGHAFGVAPHSVRHRLDEPRRVIHWPVAPHQGGLCLPRQGYGSMLRVAQSRPGLLFAAEFGRGDPRGFGQ